MMHGGSAKTRVLVVDDSSVMRRLIRHALSVDPSIEIAGEASNASEAREAVNTLQPDVMTLDVEMPNMSGLEFLRRLMKHRPMPVVMVSTLTQKGSASAIDALRLGAVDCVEKPRFGTAQGVFSRLPEIVSAAARARVGSRPPRTNAPKIEPYSGASRFVLIGGSTGAVDAVERILSQFPKNCPPTLITQHMPGPFLASFAARLDPLVAPKVSLASDGEPLETGRVLIAPGGEFHLSVTGGQKLKAALQASDRVSGHRPSVDVLFQSAVPFASRCVAAILTGMGRDGAAGLAQLQQAGALTFGQDEDSCVVFGMPRVAGEMGGVQTWSSIEDLGQKLLDAAATPLVKRGH